MSAAAPPGTWRLLAPAVIGWVAAATLIAVPGAAVWVMGASAAAGAVLVALGRSATERVKSLLGAGLVLCAVLVLLGARIDTGERARDDPLLRASAERGVVRVLDATLSGFPESSRSDFGDRWWVRAVLPSAGNVGVLLWLPEQPPDSWAPGRSLVVRGVLERFSPASPAAFGMRVVEVQDRAEPTPTTSLGSIAADVRLRLRNAAARVTGAELVPGFATGDTVLVSPTLEAHLLESSLTHLTAVSGANCALVTGAAVSVLARSGAGRRTRLAAAGGALIMFLGIVGPDPSVQRAAVMAAVVLVSGFGGKRSVALPALGLAIMVLLVIDPWQALQPGFALSVAATGGILLVARPIATWLRRRIRLPRALALAVGVALAAQLTCGPILLLLQPGIPAVGVLANVLAAPAAPLGTGLGLLAALLLPVLPEVGHAVVVLASIPARWVAAVAEVSAALPLSRWRWPDGWAGALLLAACEGLLVLAWAVHRGHVSLSGARRTGTRRPWSAPDPVPRVIRQWVAALVGTGAGLAVAVTVVVPASIGLATPRGWAVVACDVGQGDAILIRDPAVPDAVVMVDTGDDSALLADCLSRFRVARIQLLVLSHDDRDHVGALASIVDRVDRALVSPSPETEPASDREVLRQLADAEVPTRIGSAGDAGRLHDGLSWNILAPRLGSIAADRNAASLVLRMDAGETSVLLLGDTGYEEQSALLGSAAISLDVDVLKVAHHGSRDQDPALVPATDAAWALVSVGDGNGYGHPSAETLAMITRAGSRVLRTDLHGSIALVPDAEGSLEPWVAGPR